MIYEQVHVSLIQGVPFGWTAGLLLLKDHQMTKLAGFPIFQSVKCLDCLLILVLYSLAFLWNHISKQLYSQSHVKYPETEEQLYLRLGTPFSPLLECTFSQKKFNYASNSHLIWDIYLLSENLLLCLILRFFPYSCLGQPISQWPAQAALREKS